ncbi:MAG: MATE family efflux transporter, partial [Janthinobacterium lividum]
SLGFRVYGSLSNAIARPRLVMVIQLIALAIKIPANTWLVFGGFGVPALGGPGCALASTLINWISCVIGIGIMSRHTAYLPFGIFARLSWPRLPDQLRLLRLGVPMGLSYLIEVTSYTFMALFIARFGTTILAGHQIAGNMGAVLYMTPMSIGVACSTLVAQSLGAERPEAARTLSRHGILLAGGIAVVFALLLWFTRNQVVRLYTPDLAVASAAASLLAIVAFYHCFDALQVSTAFILRAYKVTVIPTVIYAVALWGVGLGGGYLLGFDVSGNVPAGLRGAAGFWIANSASLGVAAASLIVYRMYIVRHR